MSDNKIDQILKKSDRFLNGKEDKVRLALCAILSGGHALIEDVPGVGKTTLVKMLGELLSLEVSRIQFTNDLLPADIIGSSIFIKDSGDFKFIPGPIFGEIILADELNRAPAKTQSALLQAMEENKISVDNKTHQLSKFFTVLATQNPNNQIGTHDLPESQLDRFALKFSLGYPNKIDTLAMLKTKSVDFDNTLHANEQILSKNEISNIQKTIQNIHLDDSLYDYIYNLINYSREHKKFIPLSNRCAIDLVKTSKAWAYINDNRRDYVICDDIKEIFPYVAGHRLVHPGQASISNEHTFANEILSQIPIR